MGIKERRQREKEHRRTSILDSAADLFFRNGYEKTRMIEIAEDCDLSKGTLYLYFKNKEDLAQGVVERSYDILIEFLNSAADRAARGIEKLRAMLDAFRQFYHTENQHFYLATVLENYLDLPPCLETRPSHPVGEAENGLFSRIFLIRRMIIDSIRLGIEDGSIRPTLDAEVASVAYMELVFGFYKEIFDHGESLDKRMVPLERLIGEVNDLMIRTLTEEGRDYR